MTDDLERWQETLDTYDGLMLGWATFRPLPGDDSFAGGLVLVVAAAEDGDDFARQARVAVEDGGFEFEDTERVQWLTALTDVPLEVFPVAAEAAETGSTATGAFHQHLRENTPEEFEAETLAWDDVRVSGDLVEVVTFDSNVRGVLLDFSDELVLVQHVDTSSVLLDGYGLYPTDEVLRFEPAPQTFVLRALELRGDLPKPIDAPLESMRAFLGWAKVAAPLLGIMEGGEAPQTRYVGAVTTVGVEAFEVRGVDMEGAWTKEWEHRYDDVTRIDFLDNYLRALSTVLDRQERTR